MLDIEEHLKKATIHNTHTHTHTPWFYSAKEY
jgi:hypothetical protein